MYYMCIMYGWIKVHVDVDVDVDFDITGLETEDVWGGCLQARLTHMYIPVKQGRHPDRFLLQRCRNRGR